MEEAIEWVLSGGCIVYPTSTLPALGCIPNSKALDRLYGIKGRSGGAPVSLGVVSLSQASEIVHVPDDVNEILDVFPEGSLTIILRAKNVMDSRLGGDKVAVRVVSDRTAKELLRKTGPADSNQCKYFWKGAVVRLCRSRRVSSKSRGGHYRS